MGDLPIPASLIRHRTEANGEAGVAWLARLPALVAACAEQWSLRLEAPFPGLTYNYAASAHGADSTALVLKVCFPDAEFESEAAALAAFAGRGAVRLVAVDLDRGALLLERLLPGTPLSTVADDDAATTAAAGVMQRLWRPPPAGHRFRSVEDWVARMAERAPSLVAPHSAFPSGWVARAVEMTAELSASPAERRLLHGDFHQDNVLAAGTGWRAIDPKGIIGEPAAEVGPLLLNQLPANPDPATLGRLLQRRLDVLSDALGLDRERLRAWSVVRAVLSAFWSLEDHGYGWETALCCAELLSRPT